MFNSTLYYEKTVYQAFIRDFELYKAEVHIESLLITQKRSQQLIPVFNRILAKGVKIYLMTRDSKEHDENIENQSANAIRAFEIMGVYVLLCISNQHRKLTIPD